MHVFKMLQECYGLCAVGNEIMKKRLGLGSNSEISPLTLKWIIRVKRLTKMIEKVATGGPFWGCQSL
ncbi:hypothetical protein ACB098_07G129000 [Castanea mollissima]